MKKIGILTINDYNNYGNRLQNYATQEVLKSLGFSAQTVVNNTSNDHSTKFNLLKKICNLKKMTTKETCEKIYFKLWSFAYKNKIEKYKNKRVQAFKNFTSVNINETEYSISIDNIPKNLGNKFDYFITGSDQVWNPTFRHFSKIDFLTFAPANKRVAYAPSIGLSQIPREYMGKYKEWLLKMSRLSVREEAGAKIIKELTGREATILVDPSLMLSKEKWLSISKEPTNKPQNKYLLTYFLGKVTSENTRKIKEIALENKLQIVNLGDMKDLNTYTSGPSEFIHYINSASAFFTDSFHGAAFSILLEVPFTTFDRNSNIPSMNSRMDTLLSTFNLHSRKWDNLINSRDIFNVDYSQVTPVLEFERKKAIDYLKEALT